MSPGAQRHRGFVVSGFELQRGPRSQRFLFSLEAIDPTAAGTSTVRPMNDTKPTTLETLRNAIATLIGYPPKLGGLLRRRLGG